MVTEAETFTTESIERGSDEWWRDRLLSRLARSRPANDVRVSWYLGQQPVPAVPAKYKDAYKLLLDMSRNAWARLVVDSISERVRVTGVRLDGTDADLEIWQILKANHIDVDQRLVHSEALTLSTSYYSVWPSENAVGVSIVPESGLQVTHEPDPADPRRVLAALKLWEDSIEGLVYANLYLPDSTVKWTAPLPDIWGRNVEQETDSSTATDQLLNLTWTLVEELKNPYDVVPFFPFSNRPTLFAGAQSEIDDLIPVFARVDKFTLDLLLTAESGAFKQKWATGLQVPTDPDTGKPVEPFDAAVTKLWVGGKDAAFGVFDASDLTPYLTAIDASVAQVSAVSRVPSYYLVSPNLVNPPSADTMVAAEAGLVHKSRSITDYFGEQYERMVRLALKIKKDNRSDAPGLEMVWQNPAMPSDAQVADAATKWSTLGVPNEVLWEKGGASPEEIARWKNIAAREALTAQVFSDTTTVAEAEEVGPAEVEDEPETEPVETEPVETEPVETEETVETEPATEGETAGDLKAQSDSLGVLIRAGVDPKSAARQVGMPDLEFTGAVPSSLRLTTEEADEVEGA